MITIYIALHVQYLLSLLDFIVL